jgi:hypothetical protein
MVALDDMRPTRTVMVDKDIDRAVVFIVGSPRSGTTILGQMLDGHPRIAQWYEPYFVWDHYFRARSDDERSARDASPRVTAQIRKDFQRYRQRLRATLVVDKSPRNSLKIPFIKAIFPQARFIHLVRDGRDAALSIHKEWQKRRQIVNDPTHGHGFNYRKALEVLTHWLRRQPLLGDKLRALWFETHGHVIDAGRQLNRRRWRGAVGWGPRFQGWQAFYDERNLLAFNALQWLKCVESIRTAWPTLAPGQGLEIRYETMIQDGRRTLAEILAFLGLAASDAFLSALPELKKGNFNKWQRAFSQEQIETVSTLLNPMLRTLGYRTPGDTQGQLS